MLTKTIVTGSIEILENAVMQLREDTVVTEDGIEISRTFTRSVVVPGDDVSNKSQRVQDIAALLWTPQVIADWILHLPKLPTSSVPSPLPTV